LKRVIIIVFSHLLSSCNATSPIKIDEKEGQILVKKNLCDLQISFGSYGSGIPSKIQDQIIKYLNSRKGIKKLSTWAWGLEGESDYCVEISEEKELLSAKDEILKIIPPFSKDGYTILKFQGKEIFRTQWPPN